jgi:hypothetical protein
MVVLGRKIYDEIVAALVTNGFSCVTKEICGRVPRSFDDELRVLRELAEALDSPIRRRYQGSVIRIDLASPRFEPAREELVKRAEPSLRNFNLVHVDVIRAHIRGDRSVQYGCWNT